MNILFYQDTLGVSGGEIYVVDAATRLRELGHEVSLACPSGSWVDRQAESRGFPCVDFSADEGYDAQRKWLLTQHLIEHQVDVVFCSIPGMRAEVPFLDDALRTVGRGCIVVRLGVAPGEGALAPERVGVGYDTVGAVIAVSQDVKQHLLAAVPDVDPLRVHVIYNGVDHARFASDRFAEHDRLRIRSRLNVPESGVLISTIGRLDPIKNLPMLVDVADAVLSQEQDVTFLVAGDGAQADVLRQSVAERGLDAHFRFPGFVEDIPGLLHASDILAHCSRSEGVPNVVLEAMAAGKSVVATDVGGIREVVVPSQTATLVPSGDASEMADVLCEQIRDADLRQEIGRRAAEDVRARLSRQQNVIEIENLLESATPRGFALARPESVSDEADLVESDFARPIFRFVGSAG